MNKQGLTVITLLAALFCLNCGPTDQQAGEAVVVPPDKADNFLAPRAQEYLIEGESTVTIEAELADASIEERLERVRRLVPLKQVVIGWFLNAYLGPKSSHSESDYGGFETLTKNGSYEDLDIRDTGDGLTFSFKFRQEVGGTTDLLGKLPTTVDADGRHHFTLMVGKVSNQEMARLSTNQEWYRSSPWSDFDPDDVDPERLYELDLTISTEPRSTDAWIDSRRLFADGEITVGVHFGWDYHNQYHLVHSEGVYSWLVRQGFRSPVESYQDYNRSSGPLTRTIRFLGQPVVAKVWLFWGQPGGDTDPDTASGGRQLEDDMKESFSSRDVIVFSGHSGPFYGFALANWRMTDEGDLDDSEIPLLDMPADRYQVVLAEGCETYALGQAFWDNPSKSDRLNLDVITTTNFSNAGSSSTVTDFLRAVLGTGYDDDRYQPKTFMELLRDLDDNSYWFNTMYGVHGIDDNPHLHPAVNPARFCQACDLDSDCGSDGYKCARLNEAEKACFGRCSADDGCPAGWKCMDIASGSYVEWRGCVPANLTCSREPELPERPTLMINEVLADPPEGPAGDANRDGLRDGAQDEFVEIVNYGSGVVGLEGFSISDNTGTRFEFPAGARLSSGEALVVFGSGQPAGDFGAGPAYVTVNLLGLNNSGDTVSLVAPDGSVVDSLTYGREGGRERSLVRAVDGDPEAGFIQHPDQPFSPGTRKDGSAF